MVFTVIGMSLVPRSVLFCCNDASASFFTKTATALVKTSSFDGFRYSNASASLNGIVSAENAGKETIAHKIIIFFISISL